MAELDQILELGKKIDDLGAAATAAQKSAEAAQKAASGTQVEFTSKTTDYEAQIKSASEEATKAMQEANDLKQKIDSIEKTSEYVEKAIARMGSNDPNGAQSSEMEQKAAEETARYLRTGIRISDDVTESVVRALIGKSFYGVEEYKRENEIKTMIAGVNPNGGYFIRPERSATMIRRIFETSPMRSVSNIETTSSDSLEFLIDDDEATSGNWVGEVSSRGDTATPKIGLLTIPVHEQFAQPKATQKMLDDAGFDIESWLSGKVTRKMTRVENTAFVNGNGSQKPRGFIFLPAWGAAGVYERNALERINSGDANTLTGDGVKNLKNSLIEEYQAGAVFTIKRESFATIITLKDGQGRYLLNPDSFKEGDTQILLGKRVIFMDDMPVISASNEPLAYGDFGVGYTIVDRMGFRVIRDDLTDKPNTKFYTTKRVGGDVTNYESIKIQVVAA